MGVGRSTPTRNITVEDDDEDVGLLYISNAVARRLVGQTEQRRPAGQWATDSSGDPEREQIVKSLEEQYQQKLDDLEELGARQHENAKQEFAKAVEEVEQKFVKTTSSPVCSDLQQEVLKCYHANPHQTLLCSAYVRAFNDCVNNQREKLLIRQR